VSEAHTVATRAQLPDGCMRRVEVAGEPVVLYCVDGEIYASRDVCPHHGAPLSAGDFDGGVVMCPLHAWEFDVRTGECVSLPGARTLERLEVRVEGDLVKIVGKTAR
jgi:nitrite reductase/ring-hydroxylating ferredoxin subunit